jgi:hypothetical protein
MAPIGYDQRRTILDFPAKSVDELATSFEESSVAKYGRGGYNANERFQVAC